MVFHGDYDADNNWATTHAQPPHFRKGDLVFIKNEFLAGNPVGIVTEVRDVVHETSGARYTVVAAVIEQELYTLSARDYELVTPVKRAAK